MQIHYTMFGSPKSTIVLWSFCIDKQALIYQFWILTHLIVCPPFHKLLVYVYSKTCYFSNLNQDECSINLLNITSLKWKWRMIIFNFLIWKINESSLMDVILPTDPPQDKRWCASFVISAMLDDFDKGFFCQISSNMTKISLFIESLGNGCTPPPTGCPKKTQNYLNHLLLVF